MLINIVSKKSAGKCKLQGVVTWYVIRPFTNDVQSGRRDEISFVPDKNKYLHVFSSLLELRTRSERRETLTKDDKVRCHYVG